VFWWDNTPLLCSPPLARYLDNPAKARSKGNFFHLLSKKEALGRYKTQTIEIFKTRIKMTLYLGQDGNKPQNLL
jgi:hypothetical protein